MKIPSRWRDKLPEWRGATRPLLLIDVDGVLSVFGGGRHDPATLVPTLVDGVPHLLSRTAADALKALVGDFECVWCTGWKDRADSYLPLLLGLPRGWPFIRFAGLLSDQERLQALEAATVVVCPSPFESLSLLALEALSVGTPILANARSAVLVEHCVRSNGGLYYADRDEFVESLKLLVADGKLRGALGRNGADYVRQNYRWDVVLAKYERLFAKIRNAR